MEAKTEDRRTETRTAKEAGWHVSRYNLFAKVPDTKNVAIANLYAGNCAEYTPLEMYLLSVLDELDENHPIIERFAKRGIICKFDERAALETMGRGACAGGCPHKRLFTGRECIAFKDNPEAYVLALHARIGENKPEEEQSEEQRAAVAPSP